MVFGQHGKIRVPSNKSVLWQHEIEHMKSRALSFFEIKERFNSTILEL
jgi:hypothetical protein